MGSVVGVNYAPFLLVPAFTDLLGIGTRHEGGRQQ